MTVTDELRQRWEAGAIDDDVLLLALCDEIQPPPKMRSLRWKMPAARPAHLSARWWSGWAVKRP